MAIRASGVFALLYSYIYVLLRLEAYALLIGAISSFAAIALAMYVTRNVDWYGSTGPGAAFAASAPPPQRSWLQ